MEEHGTDEAELNETLYHSSNYGTADLIQTSKRNNVIVMMSF